MPYKHFTSDDRDALQVLMSTGADCWMIARILEKHPSSIYRELSRNSNSGFYLSHHASFAAEKRRGVSRSSPKRGNAALMIDIDQRLREDHSPEQIAGRLKLEHPQDPALHISYETIYSTFTPNRAGAPILAHTSAKGTRNDANACLARISKILNRTFIDERPAIVEKKSRLGDWEGDTIEGGGKKGYIGTFVDRKSKFLVAVPAQAQDCGEARTRGTSRLCCNPRQPQKDRHGRQWQRVRTP